MGRQPKKVTRRGPRIVTEDPAYYPTEVTEYPISQQVLRAAAEKTSGRDWPEALGGCYPPFTNSVDRMDYSVMSSIPAARRTVSDETRQSSSGCSRRRRQNLI